MNKFRTIPLEIVQLPGATPPEKIDMLLNMGIVLNQSPQDIEPMGSPDLDLVRIEQGALKGDWDTVALGDGAPSRILAQGEHRFIQQSTLELIEVHFRLYRTALGFAKIQSYDADTDSWVDEAESDFEIEDVYLSWISYFDAVYFADGERVFRWDRSELEEDSGADFVAGNLLTVEGATTAATITPISSDDKYRVHYRLSVIGQTTEEQEIVIAVKYSGTTVATKTHTIPADDGTDASGWTGSLFGLRSYVLPHVILEVEVEIDDSTDLLLVIESLDLAEEEIDLQLWPSSGFDEWINPRLSFVPAADENYTFGIYHDGSMASTVDVEFFYDLGAGFVSVGTQVNLVANQQLDFEVNIPALTAAAGDTVTFKITISGPSPTSFLDNINSAHVSWNSTPRVEIHGFNEATDADLTQGVTYNTTNDPQNLIELVYESISDEPIVLVGRYLGLTSFADRLMLMVHEGDPQKVAYCAPLDPDDWVGIGSDSRIIESRSDPVDEVQGFAPLTANQGALFRKKSIMRAVQTGNSQLAVAYYHWIENIGTESPFAITVVPGGVCFFGYDKHAYFLAEGMQQPLLLDDHVHEEWELLLADEDLGLVEAYYDPFSSEYVLILPY